MIKTKIQLGLKDLEDAKMIRQTVFVDEQGFEEEFDTIDDIAWHVLIYQDGKPVGVGRTFPKEKNSTTYIIGRVAVVKELRKTGLGALVIQYLEETAKKQGATRIELSSQCTAESFYKHIGYTSIGDVYLDQFAPHIKMIKEIK